MKKYLTLLLYVFVSFSINAQYNKSKSISIEEPVILPEYYKPNYAPLLEIEKLKKLDQNNLSNQDITGNGYYMGKFSERKKLDTITFKLHGRELYCAGKIQYKWDDRYSNGIEYLNILPSSDIRYQSNDQLFCPIEDITENKINPRANLFNEDGSYLYGEVLNTDSVTSTIYSQEAINQYNFKMQVYTDKVTYITSDTIGDYYPNYTYGDNPYKGYLSGGMYHSISPIAKDASVIKLENNDYYTGFATLGTYHSQIHGSFTGYLFPMQASAGNATVLFRELDGEYEWVLLVDGQIEKTIPALESDMPKIENLKNNLTNTISFTPRPKYEKGSEWVVNYRTNFGVYRSKNMSTLNGYGVNFYTKDSLRTGDIRYLEIGFFKDGKLDGLGYSCKITTSLSDSYAPTRNHFDNNSISVIEKVVAKAGFFKAGELVDGRDILIANNNQPNRNYWSKNKIPGSDYIARENFFLNKSQIFEDFKFDNLSSYDEIHIEKLGYNYPIKRIDKEKRSIVIESDNKEIYLTNESGPVYVTYINKGHLKVGCPPTKFVKNYKEIEVVKQVPGYVYNTRKVNGALVDYYYTTKTENTATYSYKKNIFSGYSTIPCPICNGTGSKVVQNNSRVYRQIIFE
ncbi:MAG TPA: hypothetical protein VKY37_03340 [Brumimicrobium sp.]|nr:hypothetical protein [Brumimicrobium sp.]